MSAKEKNRHLKDSVPLRGKPRNCNNELSYAVAIYLPIALMVALVLMFILEPDFTRWDKTSSMSNAAFVCCVIQVIASLSFYFYLSIKYGKERFVKRQVNFQLPMYSTKYHENPELVPEVPVKASCNSKDMDETARAEMCQATSHTLLNYIIDYQNMLRECCVDMHESLEVHPSNSAMEYPDGSLRNGYYSASCSPLRGYRHPVSRDSIIKMTTSKQVVQEKMYPEADTKLGVVEYAL